MDPRFENDAQTGTMPGLTAGDQASLRREPPAWLSETRSALTAPGRYLAFEQDGRVNVIPVSREWTRIGRSLAADIRFDDATVSRRHALIANEEAGVAQHVGQRADGRGLARAALERQDRDRVGHKRPPR